MNDIILETTNDDDLPIIRVPLVLEHGLYVVIEAQYFHDFLRNANGRCALCDSDDQLGMEAELGTAPRIWWDHVEEHNLSYSTCPVCEGRPT